MNWMERSVRDGDTHNARTAVFDEEDDLRSNVVCEAEVEDG